VPQKDSKVEMLHEENRCEEYKVRNFALSRTCKAKCLQKLKRGDTPNLISPSRYSKVSLTEQDLVKIDKALIASERLEK